MENQAATRWLTAQAAARDIAAEMIDGKTLTYDEYEDMDDQAADELRKELRVEGYTLSTESTERVWAAPGLALTVGRKVGESIANDALAMQAENPEIVIKWAGIDPQDGDQLLDAGIDPSSDEWELALAAAKAAFIAAVGQGAR